MATQFKIPVQYHVFPCGIYKLQPIIACMQTHKAINSRDKGIMQPFQFSCDGPSYEFMFQLGGERRT